MAYDSEPSEYEKSLLDPTALTVLGPTNGHDVVIQFHSAEVI